MSEILILRPRPEDAQDWDLRELLQIIGSSGELLYWRAAMGHEWTEFLPREGMSWNDAVELCKRIDAAEQGLPMSWPELVRLGENVFQTQWLTFLGFDSPEEPDLPSLFADNTFYLDRPTPAFFEKVAIALQCADSSYWFVHARDEALRARFRREFAK